MLLAVTLRETAPAVIVAVLVIGLVLAPEARPVNVTTPPFTGSLKALVTLNASGLAKALSTVVL